MPILLAACAALLGAVAMVMQRVALESAPHDSLSPRLIGHAVRRRAWLAGFALLLGVFVLQASALRRGQLSVVQPVITTELIFLVAILAVGFGKRIGRLEVGGILAVVTGLGTFFVSASPAEGKGFPSRQGWIVISAVSVAGALLLVLLSRVGPRWWRAAVLGAAAAILFAYNAAITKAVTTLLREGGWSRLFTSWEPYVLAVVGASGFFLVQSALHAGPITASRITSVTVNPLLSILIGATVFNEHLRSGGPYLALDVLAIAVLCVGLVVLTRSPLVAGVGGRADDEFLGASPLPPPIN